MSKHTPVTWFVDIEGNGILAYDDRTTIICHMSATVRNPEVMADAYVLSAAPELLEALEMLVDIPLIRDVAAGPLKVAVKAAEAAISKARGEL